MRVTAKEKLKIFFIALKLLLCTTLMIASTYALFTHSQRIEAGVMAGDLEMELLVYIDGEYKPIENIEENIFKNDDWEPNKTRVVYFKVISNSNIDIKYSLQFLASMGELGGAFEYCAFQGKNGELSATGWEELSANKDVIALEDGVNLLSGNDYRPMEPRDEEFWTVAVHMRADADNSYRSESGAEKKCDVRVRLHAVQGNADLTP